MQRAGQRAKFCSSLSPGGGAYSKALNTEKSCLFFGGGGGGGLAGGGGVVTKVLVHKVAEQFIGIALHTFELQYEKTGFLPSM